MNTTHLTDEQLQDIALSPETPVPAHLHTCAQCQAQVAAYRLLISGLEQQPAPAFEADFASLVVSAIPRAQPATPARRIATGWYIAAGITIAGLLLYIGYPYLLRLVSSVRPMVILLAAVTTFTILGWQCMDMYKNYRRKLDVLNFN